MKKTTKIAMTFATVSTYVSLIFLLVMCPALRGFGHDDHAHKDEKPHAHNDGEAHNHDDNDHDHDEETLRLSKDAQARFDIKISEAGTRPLFHEVKLTGEIVFNEDQLVHLAPRLSGVIRDVHFSTGDKVAAEALMAVLDSRELAEAKADFMAAHSREQLADKVYSREKALLEKQATAAQDVQEAEQQLTEARIALRLAEQKLTALGASTEEITKLIGNGKEPLTRYEISTPIAGVVIEKHVAKGETVNEESDIFTIANLDTVWVNLTVYAKDIADVKKGSKVLIRADHDGTEAEAEIASITPFMDVATRTATARVVLPNQAGKWFPGTFVTGYIRHKHDTAAVAVPRDAVQTVNGQTVVFTAHDAEAFEMTPVTIGKSDRASVEIVTGLKAGTRYVSQGAFHLKAMVITSTMDAHAGHGH